MMRGDVWIVGSDHAVGEPLTPAAIIPAVT